MKKSMKKFIVACAAVSAITVAAGMSAMAAEYTEANNSVKFNVPAGDADTQKTVLVIPTDKKGNVTEGDILYINQDAALADTALLKGTEKLADGKYVAMVGYYEGGEFKISEDEFTVGDVVDTHEVLMGDVTNPMGTINSMDAQQVLKYAVSGTAGFASDADKMIAADVSNPAGINSMDAQQILKYSVTGQAAQKVGMTAVVDANGNVVEYK
ncbi:MAG: hypothetical protein Q4G33_04175 [bacterium]|nr:hypothetical protein [bacterium]